MLYSLYWKLWLDWFLTLYMFSYHKLSLVFIGECWCVFSGASVLCITLVLQCWIFFIQNSWWLCRSGCPWRLNRNLPCVDTIWIGWVSPSVWLIIYGHDLDERENLEWSPHTWSFGIVSVIASGFKSRDWAWDVWMGLLGTAAVEITNMNNKNKHWLVTCLEIKQTFGTN